MCERKRRNVFIAPFSYSVLSVFFPPCPPDLLISRSCHVPSPASSPSSSLSLSLSLFLDASGLLAHNARARFFWSRVQKPRRACGFLRNGRVNHQLPAREKGRGWRVAAAPPWLSLRQFRAISSRQRERTKTHENTRDSRFTVHRLPGRQEFERHAVI